MHDADPDPGGGVAAVLFEVELALEGVAGLTGRSNPARNPA